MTYVKISQVAHYVPQKRVTNDELSQLMDTSDEWIVSRTGIRARHISQGENTSDLAIRVAQSLLEKSYLNPLDLDFILVATISPDSSMPSTAARVQAAIGAHSAFAFDVTAACSGFVFALATAEKFLVSGAYQKGLVIGAEVLSKIVDWSDRSTAVLFGDGAGGVLLETTPVQHFLAESLYSDGRRGDSLTSSHMGLSSPFAASQDSSFYLQMNGREVFDFVVRDVSKSIKDILFESGFEPEDMDYYFTHQANSRLLDKLAKKVGASREKFLSNMAEYGNTSAASIPILLSEAVLDGQLRMDGSQTILLSGFGGGLTWGNLIVKI